MVKKYQLMMFVLMVEDIGGGGTESGGDWILIGDIFKDGGWVEVVVKVGFFYCWCLSDGGGAFGDYWLLF